MLRLLADSTYLKQANLDWQEFYAQIEEDSQAVRCSQHAASFLMTLLPNVKTLKLPTEKMKPLDATDKLASFARPTSRISLTTGLALPRSPDLSHRSQW